MVDNHQVISKTNNNKKLECYATTAQILHQKKKIKREHLSTISLGWIHSRKGSRKSKDLKCLQILFNTGCGGTLIDKKFLTKLKTKKVTNTEWTTKASSFKTKQKAK